MGPRAVTSARHQGDSASESMVATQHHSIRLLRSFALIGAVYSNMPSAPVCRTYLFSNNEDLNKVMSVWVAHHRDSPGGAK